MLAPVPVAVLVMALSLRMTTAAICPAFHHGGISPRADCSPAAAAAPAPETTEAVPGAPVRLPQPAAIVARPPLVGAKSPSYTKEPLRRAGSGGMIFPNDRLQDSPEGQSQCLGNMDSLYNGCGVTKTCFGYPAGCEATRNCQGLGTVRYVNDFFTFQAMATNIRETGAKYIAIGLAESDRMYAASVMECQLSKDGQDVELYMSWNDADNKKNRRIDDRQSLTLLDKSVQDNSFCCDFTRVNRTKILNQYEFYMDERPYYLLLASGKSATSDNIGYHDLFRIATKEKVVLYQASTVGAASPWLLRLHSAVMVLAWLFCVPLGALTARYFKAAWGKGQLCGAALWFSYHRTLMFTALSLSGVGGLAALIHLQGWSESAGLHGILGATATCLAVVQVLGSFLRPAPDHPRRPIFNFLHHTGGYAAQLFAVVVVYLSVGLKAAMVPTYLYYVISAWVVFFIAMHALHTLSTVRPFYIVIVIFGLALTSIAILVIVVIAPGST